MAALILSRTASEMHPGFPSGARLSDQPDETLAGQQGPPLTSLSSAAAAAAATLPSPSCGLKRSHITSFGEEKLLPSELSRPAGTGSPNSSGDTSVVPHGPASSDSHQQQPPSVALVAALLGALPKQGVGKDTVSDKAGPHARRSVADGLMEAVPTLGPALQLLISRCREQGGSPHSQDPLQAALHAVLSSFAAAAASSARSGSSSPLSQQQQREGSEIGSARDRRQGHGAEGPRGGPAQLQPPSQLPAGQALRGSSQARQQVVEEQELEAMDVPAHGGEAPRLQQVAQQTRAQSAAEPHQQQQPSPRYTTSAPGEAAVVRSTARRSSSTCSERLPSTGEVPAPPTAQGASRVVQGLPPLRVVPSNSSPRQGQQSGSATAGGSGRAAQAAAAPRDGSASPGDRGELMQQLHALLMNRALSSSAGGPADGAAASHLAPLEQLVQQIIAPAAAAAAAEATAAGPAVHQQQQLEDVELGERQHTMWRSQQQQLEPEAGEQQWRQRMAPYPPVPGRAGFEVEGDSSRWSAAGGGALPRGHPMAAYGGYAEPMDTCPLPPPSHVNPRGPPNMGPGWDMWSGAPQGAGPWARGPGERPPGLPMQLSAGGALLDRRPLPPSLQPGGPPGVRPEARQQHASGPHGAVVPPHEFPGDLPPLKMHRGPQGWQRGGSRAPLETAEQEGSMEQLMEMELNSGMREFGTVAAAALALAGSGAPGPQQQLRAADMALGPLPPRGVGPLLPPRVLPGPNQLPLRPGPQRMHPGAATPLPLLLPGRPPAVPLNMAGPPLRAPPPSASAGGAAERGAGPWQRQMQAPVGRQLPPACDPPGMGPGRNGPPRPSSASRLQVGGGMSNQWYVTDPDVIRYHRVLACKTYLLRLHVTAEMAEHLLPLSPNQNPAAELEAAASGAYTCLFKVAVHLVDPAGRVWKVQYENNVYKDQKHPRLTRGWRDLVRLHELQIGDTVVFERRSADRQVLHVYFRRAERLLEGGEGRPPAAAAGPRGPAAGAFRGPGGGGGGGGGGGPVAAGGSVGGGRGAWPAAPTPLGSSSRHLPWHPV